MRSPCASGIAARSEAQRRAAGEGRRRGWLHQREVVDRVEGEQLQRPFRSIVGGAVDEAIALRLQRRLADHVIVGDDVAFVADEEAGPDAGLAVLPFEQRPHLQQLRARLVVDALGRRRDRRWSELAPRAARRFRRRLLPAACSAQEPRTASRNQPVRPAARRGLDFIKTNCRRAFARLASAGARRRRRSPRS